MLILRHSAFAFCTDFAAGTDANIILNTRFTRHPEIQEHGPSWAISRLPYLGHSWIGRRTSEDNERTNTDSEDISCDAYFQRLGNTLSFHPGTESIPPIEEFIVSGGDIMAEAVLVKISSTVESAKTGKKWEETFAFLLSRFDENGRIGKLEIWADSLSAWIHSE